jgi:broad specificity phosphatase PhoE
LRTLETCLAIGAARAAQKLTHTLPRERTEAAWWTPLLAFDLPAFETFIRSSLLADATDAAACTSEEHSSAHLEQQLNTCMARATLGEPLGHAESFLAVTGHPPETARKRAMFAILVNFMQRVRGEAVGVPVLPLKASGGAHAEQHAWRVLVRAACEALAGAGECSSVTVAAAAMINEDGSLDGYNFLTLVTVCAALELEGAGACSEELRALGGRMCGYLAAQSERAVPGVSVSTVEHAHIEGAGIPAFRDLNVWVSSVAIIAGAHALSGTAYAPGPDESRGELSRESLVQHLRALSAALARQQIANGSFAFTAGSLVADTDVTAYCMQALAQADFAQHRGALERAARFLFERKASGSGALLSFSQAGGVDIDVVARATIGLLYCGEESTRQMRYEALRWLGAQVEHHSLTNHWRRSQTYSASVVLLTFCEHILLDPQCAQALGLARHVPALCRSLLEPLDEYLARAGSSTAPPVPLDITYACIGLGAALEVGLEESLRARLRHTFLQFASTLVRGCSAGDEGWVDVLLNESMQQDDNLAPRPFHYGVRRFGAAWWLWAASAVHRGLVASEPEPAETPASTPVPLLLVRHGPTTSTGASRLHADKDVCVPLEHGARAEELLADLAGLHWAAPPVWAVLSSPARRCRETAGLLLEVLRRRGQGTVLGTWQVDWLHEMRLGFWGGTEYESVRHLDPLMKAMNRGGRHVHPPGGESMHELMRRVRRGLDETLLEVVRERATAPEVPPAPLVVVTVGHCMVLNALHRVCGRGLETASIEIQAPLRLWMKTQWPAPS